MNRLRVVVASTNAETGREVCSFLKEKDYEIVAVTDSGEEAVKLIFNNKPQIVVTDVYLAGLDVCGLMQRLSEDGYNEKTVFSVATSINNGAVIESVLGSGVDMFTLIPFNAEYTDKKLRELYLKKSKTKSRDFAGKIINIADEFEILNYVSRLMHEVGVPASIRGYDYIRESILMALTDRNVLKSITKELYPSIAKNNSTTASRVERAIRHAVEVAWQRGDVDVLNGIFGYTVKSTKGKPTNGEFISMLAERVRLDLKIS